MMRYVELSLTHAIICHRTWLVSTHIECVFDIKEKCTFTLQRCLLSIIIRSLLFTSILLLAVHNNDLRRFMYTCSRYSNCTQIMFLCARCKLCLVYVNWKHCTERIPLTLSPSLYWNKNCLSKISTAQPIVRGFGNRKYARRSHL